MVTGQWLAEHQVANATRRNIVGHPSQQRGIVSHCIARSSACSDVETSRDVP